MSRIQALWTAGALTGLVIVALFWWGTGSSEAVTATSSNVATPNETTVDAATAITTGLTTSDTQSLLEQNRQLRETVTTLLNREKEYRRQIEAANQQLLSDHNAPASTGQGIGTLFEDREYEDEKYEDDEHDEHEHEYNEHDEDD